MADFFAGKIVYLDEQAVFDFFSHIISLQQVFFHIKVYMSRTISYL